MDFAKAFDDIDHNLLLRKLPLYGLSNDTLHLMSSFLSNREQLVCINTIRFSSRKIRYSTRFSVRPTSLFSLYKRLALMHKSFM